MCDEEDYDSEDDVDYVPQAEDVSEEENSGDEEDLSVLDSQDKVSGKRKGKAKKDDLGPRKRHGGIKLENDQSTENEVKSEENVELAKQIKEEKEEKKKQLEKKKADDLWSSFMSDVKPPPKKVVPSSSGLGSLSSTTTVAKTSENGDSKVKEKTLEVKKTVEVTKVFDFAGEEVKITKTVSADSKEGQKELKLLEEKTSPAPVKQTSSVLSNLGSKRPAGSGGGSGGLGGVLNKIGKKQKISVLDKSKMDWNTFKKDEGIEDELKIHNNSKDGYIERMKFLQRTDLRQFEIEKDLRLSTSKR